MFRKPKLEHGGGILLRCGPGPSCFSQSPFKGSDLPGLLSLIRDNEVPVSVSSGAASFLLHEINCLRCRGLLDLGVLGWGGGWGKDGKSQCARRICSVPGFSSACIIRPGPKPVAVGVVCHFHKGQQDRRLGTSCRRWRWGCIPLS